MKVLTIFASIVALCAAQTRYSYSAYLDVNELFQMNWSVLAEQKDVEIQLVVKTSGWISLMITSEDGTYADAIVGGYDDEMKTGYLSDMHLNLTSLSSHGLPAVDYSPDLILQDASFDNGYTTLTIKRSINTEDVDDVAIRAGPLLLGWAFSDVDDTTKPHTNGAYASLAMIPI